MAILRLRVAGALMLAAAGLAAVVPAAPAAAAKGSKAELKQIEQAFAEIQKKRPEKAIELLDRVIAANEAANAQETRQIYAASTPAEALLYSGMAAKAKKDAIVLGPNWALALFLKGFALVDLNKPDEAKPLLDRALSLAPMNAQFLSELGEWHKNRQEWDQAHTFFERATGASDLMEEPSRSFHKRRALRGMGFALIEMGKLDDAEALFRRCLEIDPNDAAAKNELEYIEEQRAKAKPRAA